MIPRTRGNRPRGFASSSHKRLKKFGDVTPRGVNYGRSSRTEKNLSARSASAKGWLFAGLPGRETRARDRSAGYGGELFDWLVEQAREKDCEHLELDSGVQRFDAHRFYLLKRMEISSYHFSLPIDRI